MISIAQGTRPSVEAAFRGVIPGSEQSDGFVTLHRNVGNVATAGGYAAETTALLHPLSATTAGIVALRITHPISRAIFRLRYPQGVVIATTQPVVQIFSIFGEPVAGVFPDDGSVGFMRLDAQAAETAGLKLSALGSTRNLRDTNYCYSDPSSLAGLDLQCGQYLMGLVEQAGVVTTGPLTGPIELQALLQS